MPTPLKVLILEDRETDAKLMLHALRQAGYTPQARRVDNETDFSAALDPSLDVILADYGLPGWSGGAALAIVQRTGIDVPLILVSGTIPDEGAVALLQQGAADYLLKDRLARLGSAVGRALDERRLRREKRSGEEALRRAEANYRGIFENAHEGIVQTTTDGTLLTVNPAMARIFGYDSPAQFQREAVNITHCYAEPTERAALMRQLRDSGRILNHEIRFRRRDGRLIWASVSIQVVRDESGAEHFEGTVEDITGRKQAEELRHEAEQRFVRQRNTLINLTGADHERQRDLAARFQQITERSARTLEVSRVSLWLFNEARTAIRCADLYELAADRHSAGMELAAADFPSYFEALAGMDVVAVEDPRRDPRTSEFTDSYLAPLGITSMLDAGIRVHGRVEGVLCHEQTDRARDWKADEQTFAAALANLASLALMDAQRQAAEEALRTAEGKLRTIIEHSNQVFYSHTPDNVLTYVSPQVREMLDCDPAEALRPWTEFLTGHPDNATGVALTQAAIETGRRQRPYQLEVQTGRGRRRWVEVRESPVVVEGRTVAIVGALTDITERKQAEDALRLFRTLIDQSNDLITVVDPKTARFIDVNESACRGLGYTREEMLALTVIDIAEGIDRTAFDAATARTEIAGHVTFESVSRRKDGSTYPVEVRLSLVTLDRAYLVAITLDITARKNAEAALQRSERYFRALTDHSLDIVSVVDSAGMVRHISPSIERVLGWKPEEHVGRSAFDWVHPDDVGQIRALFESKISEPGASATAEFRCRHKDGSWRVLEAIGSNLLHEPAVGGIVINSRDITERRAAEGALRREQALFADLGRAIPDHIYFKDRQSRFVRINDAQARRFGLRSPDEAVGKTDFEIFGREHARQALADEQRIMETGEPLIGVEEKETWPDGRITWVSTTKVPLRDAEGRITGLVGISRDITEKKLLEEKFLHAQRLESLGMLAAGIAHDLNNTLAPIVFAAPMLRESVTSQRDLKILDTLEKSAQRGAGLVKQILGFAHRSSGEPLLTQVKHIARDIVSMIEETFPKSIRLEPNIPSALWPVMANPTQLHQVLLNLCVNARDAMPRGGTLRLTLANRRLAAEEVRSFSGAQAAAWLVIEVTDTGSGIAPDVLAHIWEPFFTTKGEGKGTGLGLSTVRAIIANHRGHIELDTEPGRGTTVRLFLPAVDADARDAATEPRSVPLAGHGELVLVVDDERAIRESIAAVLRKYGFNVLNAGDGLEAVTHFMAHAAQIALVITDVDMPLFSGAALARQLLQFRPEVRLIAMSGLSRGDVAESDIETIKKLAHGFLVKPFAAGELVAAVQRVLHPSLTPEARPNPPSDRR